MPELPEAETIRLKLIDKIKGLTISGLNIFEKKQFIGNFNRVIGSKIADIQRRGKILIIKLDNTFNILVHLKMSGRLLFHAKLFKPLKHTRIIINFVNGSFLEFNDVRKFGWIKIVDDQTINDTEFKRLGVEPLSGEFTKKYLKTILLKSSKAIKFILLDQEKIAGIGNIYACEVLFSAGIRPNKPGRNLSDREMNSLHKVIVSVLKKGIVYGGSSAKDGGYVQPDGRYGSYQEHFLVYQREGEFCINNCGERITKIKMGGRGTFYCSSCQK